MELAPFVVDFLPELPHPRVRENHRDRSRVRFTSPSVTATFQINCAGILAICPESDKGILKARMKAE
jgi:hypothetical protein